MFETSLETFYYVLFVVFLFYWLKKKFFSAKDVINDIQPKEIILEVRTVVEKPKKIKKYALNVSSIKLTLYPNETFKSAKLNKLYQEVVVKHYLLDEPFHTLFVYLLRQIEINNLWVKNYAKKEFIINIRDEQNREVKKVGFRIFDK